jgi:hypothetical protein
MRADSLGDWDVYGESCSAFRFLRLLEVDEFVVNLTESTRSHSDRADFLKNSEFD